MADLTLAEIDAELVEMRAALKEWLLGKRRGEVGYSSGSVKFAGDFVATPALIRQRIAELEVLRKKLTGQPTGGGPIRIGFGDRV
jgi:hypothetical protein